MSERKQPRQELSFIFLLFGRARVSFHLLSGVIVIDPTHQSPEARSATSGLSGNVARELLRTDGVIEDDHGSRG